MVSPAIFILEYAFESKIRMIYVHLKCGLGNQLFQYAAGLSFEGQVFLYRAYANYHSPTDYRYLFKRGIPLEDKVHCYTLDLNGNAHGSWDPASHPRPIALEGYFQNLPSLTSLPLVLEDLRESLAITPVKKTFIHVRRGDYLNCTHVYGTLGEEYYKRAMALFQSDTEFIVLSNDIAWCKQQPWLAHCEMIDEPNELKALAIMGSCEGAIIPNSTFAWWGAMISAKKVVYPSRWFYDLKPDLFPQSWICVCV